MALTTTRMPMGRRIITTDKEVLPTRRLRKGRSRCSVCHPHDEWGRREKVVDVGACGCQDGVWDVAWVAAGVSINS